MRIWVVCFKWLSGHACVQISTELIHFSRNGSGLRRPERIAFFLITLGIGIEAHRNCLSILHQDAAARGHSRVLEVGVRFVQFRVMDCLLLLNCLHDIGFARTC